jgi:hypothetical protein
VNVIVFSRAARVAPEERVIPTCLPPFPRNWDATREVAMKAPDLAQAYVQLDRFGFLPASKLFGLSEPLQ